MKNDDQHLEVLREISKLLVVNLKREANQTDLIIELDKSGFTPKRIAELLGTTANTVSVALSQKKKKKK